MAKEKLEQGNKAAAIDFFRVSIYFSFLQFLPQQKISAIFSLVKMFAVILMKTDIRCQKVGPTSSLIFIWALPCSHAL